MRSLPLNLTAAGLITVSIVMIHQRSRKNAIVFDALPPRIAKEIEADVPARYPNDVRGSVGRTNKTIRREKNRTLVATGRSQENLSNRSENCISLVIPTDPTTYKTSGANEVVQISRWPNSESQDQAIQLGENVRLPAAIIATSHLEMEKKQIPPALAAATKEIENVFYQELAGKLFNNPTTNSGGSGAAQPNTVILSEQEVAAARDRADAVFRTLYGDEATNRHGISSMIEVSLPKNDSDGNP